MLTWQVVSMSRVYIYMDATLLRNNTSMLKFSSRKQHTTVLLIFNRLPRLKKVKQLMYLLL